MYKHTLLLITVFGFLIPGITHATSYTVTTTDDELDGSPSCITGSSTDCSLREAIEEANADTSGDHTIILDAQTYTLSIGTPPLNMGISIDNDDNINGDLDITNTSSAITIIGAGPDDTIINGDGSIMQERVLEVLANTNLELQNLRISDGNAANGTGIRGGGAIYTDGNLTLDTVQIESNIAGVAAGDGLGGGIYVTADGAVVMTDSIISNNTASLNGGGIYSEGSVTISTSEILTNTASSTTTSVGGGGIMNSGGTATITQTEMTGNIAESTASNAFGGGIYSDQNSTTTITNTTFSDNTALTGVSNDSFGGGSYVFDNSATVTLKHATIAHNTAEAGGGIAGPHTLKHNIIASNTASNADDDDDCYGTMISSSGFNVLENNSPNCDGMDSDVSNSIDANPGLDNSLNAVDGPDYYPFSDPASSIAVNSIPAANCVTILGENPIDQLGNDRIGTCDAGAFEYQDGTAPIISLTGASAINAECGEAYTDPGATATDAVDGSLAVTADTSDVDISTLGSYTVSYSATDESTNTDTADRTVTILDTTAPTVTLTGASTVTVQQGDEYTERSATANDACDNSVSVTRTGSIDTLTPGEYVFTYSSTDDSENTGTAQRTVIVESIGDVTRVTPLSRNRVRIRYSSGATRTFTVFSRGSAKPKAALSVDGERIVAMNKKAKKIRVLNAFSGEILNTKIVNRSAQRKARLKVKKIYRHKPYDSVIIASSKNQVGKITVFRLTTNDRLTKKKTRRLTISKTAPIRITIQRAKKRFTTRFGSGEARVRGVWKLKRRGGLVQVR